MFATFYDTIAPVLGSKTLRLLMTDTDSWAMSFETYCLETTLAKLKPVMDYSSLDPDHVHFSVERQGTPGYYKIEHRNPISHFVSLRSKCYCYVCVAAHDLGKRMADLKVTSTVTKCKGIKRSTVAQELRFQHYKEALFARRKFKAKFRTIQARNFTVGTAVVNRTALCSVDSKRYYTCDIHSHAFGSILIKRSHGGCCFYCLEDNRRLRQRLRRLDLYETTTSNTTPRSSRDFYTPPVGSGPENFRKKLVF